MVRNIIIINIILFLILYGWCHDVHMDCNSFGNDHFSEFGKAQYIREHPPPYRFRFINDRNETVKRYREGIYTINLSGRRYFRRVFIQAKLTTKYGYVMGNLANGEFVQDETNADDAKFQLLQCSSQYNNTLTSLDDEKKYSLNVKWIPKKNDGPVQFIVTIEHEPSLYWYQWTPRGGLVLPESNEQFTGVLPLEVQQKTQKQSRFLVSNSDSQTVLSSAEKHLNIRRRPTSTNVKTEESDQESTGAKNCTTCFRNGRCQYDENDKNKCICKPEWIGDNCKARNYCHYHRCKFGGTCINGEFSYTCQCNFGFGGRFCQFQCPSNLCENNGTCLLDNSNQYLCVCKAGWAGDKCDKLITDVSINSCSPNPCLNGGKCVTNDNSFACECSPGFMGKLCHRPCQDIYRSCDTWKGEDSCSSLRDLSKFFDTNCPVSCDQCQLKDNTINTDKPLPPLLEPLSFILGVWSLDYPSANNYPTNFDDSTPGYYEEINFSVPTVSMFGLPNINFVSTAVSKSDSSDVHTRVGFLHLIDHKNSLKVALISSGNDGMSIIEEGTLVKNEIQFYEVFRFVNHQLFSISGRSIPNNLNRKFSFQNDTLTETVERYEKDGNLNTFVKKYGKLKSYIPY